MNGLIEELRAALYTVWSRKWVALAAAWGICLVGWLAVAAIPNTYESKARISSSSTIRWPSRSASAWAIASATSTGCARR